VLAAAIALACVIGEMDLLRALGLAGIPCASVSRPGDLTRHSRFTKATVDWADPWREPEELVKRLLAFGRAQAEKPVLFYDGDWDLLLVSRYRDRLVDTFRFVVADAELVEDLVDKDRFRTLSARLGLPVPPSTIVRAGDTPDAKTLQFPLLLKPLTRQHETWRPLVRAKALRADGPDDLDAVWPQLGARGVDVLAQEIIPGPESAIESYHVYVRESGETAAEFTGRKLRTYPRRYGYSTALEITDDHDVTELGRDLVARLGLTGVAKFDFKRDESRRLHLLEVNPRFSLWHHPGALAGVNIPALVYSDLTGATAPELRPVRAGVHWCSVRDFQAAREQGIPLRRWLGFFLACEARSKVALDDPVPLVRAALARLR
jgi:predicted ATP-grasp superfamily ATP-dependent carboligase